MQENQVRDTNNSKTISNFSGKSGSVREQNEPMLVSVDDPNYVIMVRSDFDALIKTKDDTIRNLKLQLRSLERFKASVGQH